jgi:hypothetical protein
MGTVFTAPVKRRKSEYSRDLVPAVREIRPIPAHTLRSLPSAATIGRLIRREKLFLRVGYERA